MADQLSKEPQKQPKNLTKQNPTLPRQVFIMSLIWGEKIY